MADNSQNSNMGNKNNDAADLQQRAAAKGAPSKGMTSPDSTQVPLRADTGEPDQDAIGGRSANSNASDADMGDVSSNKSGR